MTCGRTELRDLGVARFNARQSRSITKLQMRGSLAGRHRPTTGIISDMATHMVR
jgi:hypothetical protein